MSRNRISISAASLLLGAGLALSACAAVPAYGVTPYPYAYNAYAAYPYDDPLALDFGGYRYFHDHRNFDHAHFATNVGHGFGRFGGHGFAGHGFAGHGGFGGRGDGGHR